mmetsp:Transcript_80967/g.147737  ORF Transcript_80967/g.147737 Transcript_80967/m.147737 type:complete len:680 (+) Transcript_80967:54-2093(+)
MKIMFVSTVVLALMGASANEVEQRVAVTPVQKVIQLMEGMLAKGKDEKHKEQVQFAAYKQWCDDTSAQKAASIEEAESQIAILKADIAKSTATAADLAKQIDGHEEDIAVYKGDITAATKVREIEKVEFDKMHADYSESIDALERAIAVLKKQNYDREQAESFIQVRNLNHLNLIPEKAKRALDLFLNQGVSMLESAGQAEMAAPEANAYEFQSSGVIEMLEKLLDDFTEKRTDLEKNEMKSKHAYEMLIADLESMISKAESDATKKSEDKASELQKKADAEGDLTETSDVLAADTKYKTDMDATCAQKASDFESRQELRAEELEAIEKAISIIASSSVSGNADTYLPSMLQKTKTSKGTALAMLRAVSTTQAQARVAAFLHKQASHLNSRLLANVAAHISDDPFQKVKKMIKDLIVRLMNEANEEAEHKGWCDTEMATNAHTRKEKTDAIAQLTAESDELTASIAKLSEDIAELTQAVADLDAAMAKATKMRAEEKEKNEQTVSDSQEAQAAVSQALLVLKDFYSKAAEATAFVQKTKQPEIFEGAYTGMQDENGGVIGMLEVIDSDFARLESDTKAAEASALKEYEEFMEDSNIDKTAKTKDIEFKTTKKQDESSMLVSKKGDLENTQAELDEALTYFDKLKPSCVDADVSYEDRVARRQQEIESLQEALKILNGEA